MRRVCTLLLFLASSLAAQTTRQRATTEPVSAADLKPSAGVEYVIRPRDLLKIAMVTSDPNDTRATQRAETTRVNDRGMLDVQPLGLVLASGMTERQLERFITRLLTERGVRVTSFRAIVTQGSGKTFTVAGGINQPGTYQIQGYNFRLSNALQAGRGAKDDVDHAWVIRWVRDAQDQPPRRKIIEIPLKNLKEVPKSFDLLIRPRDAIVLLGANEFAELPTTQEAPAATSQPADQKP